MPKGNGNGPMGMGPMTGRGMGYCAGLAEPGYQNRNGFGAGNGYRSGAGYGNGNGAGYGKRSGFGCGGRRGNRHMFYATGQPRRARYRKLVNAGPEAAFDEKTALKNQAAFLAVQLEQVNKRLSDLET